MRKSRWCGAALCMALCALALFSGQKEKAALQASSAHADTARVLIPGGQAVGVALKTQGVLVISRASRQEIKTPLHVGDVILSVQGEAVLSAQELSEKISRVDADSVELSVLRSGREIELSAALPVSGADGRRRLGVWVRDSTAGVGTLSYIDPDTKAYGALGHAIVDGDTGDMLSVRDGAILQAQIVSVTRGESGRAGELKGSFLKEGRQIGTLEHNSVCGIYGTMQKQPEGLLYPQGLPVADFREVHTGPAVIISTVDSEGPREYSVEILRCYDQNKSGQKDMILRVTDENLLAKTGGIVQGMSGSPIIQDGKLIGAVTHVLVNDPTRGYGIFIENMMEAAG